MNTEMMLLSKVLSCLSGYELLLNRSVYEWMEKFQIEESQKCTFNKEFLILAASYINRITLESGCDDFISNGAVFTEALCLQFKMDKNSIECDSPEDARMIKTLLDIAGRAQHYDAVIHIRNAGSKDFDAFFAEFYEKYHIPCHFYDGASQIKKLVESISKDIEIPRVRSVDSVIWEEIQAITLKTKRS